MQIFGVQIIAVLFAFSMFYITFLHFKKNDLSTGLFLAWSILWTIFIVLTLFPKLLQPMIGPLRIFRVLDLLMLGAFVVLTLVTFENQIKNRRLEKQIEELVRKEALQKVKNKKWKK